jgi:DNA primase
MKGHHLEECPFCNGHNCFSIKDGFYKCFQCDAGGDVFIFLEKYGNLSRSDALKKAAEIANIRLSDPSPARAAERTVKERILIDASFYYHSNMLENGGKDYLLKKRGHSEDVLNSMRIGWSDGRLLDHLRGKGYSDDEILSTGLARERKEKDNKVVRDLFAKDLVIFPHIVGDRVLHFTIKDSDKKRGLGYQLPKTARSKEWRFYNQGALRHNEIIVVEGENDLLTVMGAGINHVVGLIGQVSGEQITALKTAANGKHLYLWMDRDETGESYIEKICQALRSQSTTTLRIIVHPGDAKDPDDYLRSTEDRRKEVLRLQDEAVDYLTWDIKRVSKKHGALDDKLRALKDRKVFMQVANMPLAEQEAFIEKLTALGFSREAIDEQLEVNQELRQRLGVYFEQAGGKKNSDPNRIASIIFDHFSENGRFFRDSQDKVYLLYQHIIYEIANNRRFNALMKKSSELLPTKEPGRSLWEALASDAYNSGTFIDLASWISTDRSTDSIFVNLNGPNNSILKLNAKGIEEVPNGLNKEGVLLKSSPRIRTLNFRPDVPIREGMKLLRELVLDNLTCELEQRYLILCWLVSAFMIDFSPYMGLMKFSGASASGKTTAARLLSLLLYGTEQLGEPTASAAYSVAAQNPLLVIDNLEQDDITKSIFKFLLLSATRGSKEKRAGGTDSDTVQEKPKALVLVTAIEPFTKAELINRTYDVEFSHRFKQDGFVEDDVVGVITKRRDVILSAVLKFLHAEILPNLEKRKDYIAVLKKEHRGHAKNRTDEYLALLMLILEKLLAHMPVHGDNDFLHGINEPREIRRAWIEYQDRKAKDTETSSNMIIKLLDGLVREYLMAMQTKSKDDVDEGRFYDIEGPVYTHQHPHYHLKMIKTPAKTMTDPESQEMYSEATIEFTATSGDIASAFDRYCRDHGLRNPYSTASVFGERLKNDKFLLKSGQWELVTKTKAVSYFKIIRGTRYYRFRKTLVR